MKNLARLTWGMLFLCIAFITNSSRATVYYWDPEGTTSQTTAPGTWDNSTAEWSTANTLTATPVAWPGNVAACFCAGSVNGTFTVTVNTSITNCAGIFNGSLTPPGCFLTLSGSGSIWLASGEDAFDTSGSDGGTTTIAVPLTGPGTVTLEGGDPQYFNATNTYSGGTELGFSTLSFRSTLNFNNGSAFGTGSIKMVNGSCGLAVEGSAAVTVPNSWIAASTSVNIVGNTSGLTFSGPWNLSGGTPSIGAASLVILSGVMSGSGGLNKWNTGTLELNAANTYTGPTTITNGTLSLGPSGSINSSSKLTISAASIFDVSAISSYTLGGSTTLLGAGTGTASTTFAEIKGASGGSVSLGSRPVILNFTPTGTAGDTTHPSLYVSQGSLKLNNNSITITNLSTNTLGPGTYRLIQVGNGTSGSISGTPNPNFAFYGTGLLAGTAGALVVSNGNLNLVVKPAPSITGLTNSDTLTLGVGVTGVTLSGTLSAPGPVYPNNGDSISVNLNGTPLTAHVTNSTGNFSVTFDPTNIAYASNSYPLTLTFGGDSSLAPLTNTSSIAANAFYYGNGSPGFFSGMDLLFTNTSGIAMYTWSTTNPALPVAFWNLEGQMQEQPQGSNESRYTINVNPTYPLVYYVCGPSIDWPYQTPTEAQWLDTDTNGNSTWFPTNTSITVQGVLGIPAGPVILQDPVGETVLAGKNAAFNVVVTGSAPLAYQWYYDTNSLLAGMTSSSLVLSNVTASEAGSYSVVVSNANGTAQSALAILQVVPPPLLSEQIISNGFQWSGYAAPGENYLIQRATNLAPPVVWTTISTNQAGTNGLVQFSDTNTLANPNVFYRLLFQ
ncbi:MAG TPA: autotransporter-associated beta strand repeat-containing protein [Verrucomicrobiae bacterium]|nr:autotransporter-associated beta strand repeat-containing protein [Verrucomicrobiae bacterium]